MSKTSSCIELLKILYSRNRVVGIRELADSLETNERNIPEYVKELRDIGYDIKTMPGRYGGYILERHSTFPTVNLTDEEKNGFMAGYEYLLSRNDFLRIKQFGKAVEKISSAIMSRDTVSDNILIANRFPLAMPQKELEERYFAINKAIENKLAFEMQYLTQKNKTVQRTIHPYKLFMYNNAWFVLGFDELYKDILYFKINRIQKFNITDKKFRVLAQYNESDYIDEFGMKNNGDWYPVKLKLSGKYAMLSTERLYGKNQKVEQFEGYSILSCEMQNKGAITSFVLGFGEFCEIIEPNWLKDEVKSQCEKILGNLI